VISGKELEGEMAGANVDIWALPRFGHEKLVSGSWFLVRLNL
jgi:hypothetical protein